MTKQIAKADVLKLMRKAQGDLSLRSWAASIGISVAYLSDVYRGKREPGPGILARLGLEKVEASYRQKSKGTP